VTVAVGEEIEIHFGDEGRRVSDGEGEGGGCADYG
jgi:hypothetical protein